MQSPATQRAPAPAPEQGAPVLDSDGRPIRARPTQPLDAASTSGAVQAMDTSPVPPQVLIDAGAFAALACEVHRRVDAVERRLDRTLRDDGAWVTWLLSASVGPTVHLISSQLLVCASKQTCDAYCGMCERSNAALQDNDPVDVVRAVERAAKCPGTRGHGIHADGRY